MTTAHGRAVDLGGRVHVPQSHRQVVRGEAEEQPLGQVDQLHQAQAGQAGLHRGPLRHRPLRRNGESRTWHDADLVVVVRHRLDRRRRCCRRRRPTQVPYNITNWLEKNKDPLNDTVVDQFKKGNNALVCEIFADHPGQSGGKEEAGGKGGSLSLSSSIVSIIDKCALTKPFAIAFQVASAVKAPVSRPYRLSTGCVPVSAVMSTTLVDRCRPL